MNFLILDDYALNLDRINEVVRHPDGKAVVYFSDRDETALYGADAARLWAALGGRYECGPPAPSDADRAHAAAEFAQLFPDAHTTEPTPLEALGEPPADAIAAAFWEVAR